MFGGGEDDDGVISATLLRDGKRQADQSLALHEAQLKRCRRSAEEDGHAGGQGALRRLELDCEGAVRNSSHHDVTIPHDKLSSLPGVAGDGESEDRLGRERDEYAVVDEGGREEVEEEEMEDDEPDDNEDIGDIEEVDCGDDEGNAAEQVMSSDKDDAAQDKIANCSGAGRDAEDKEVRDEERGGSVGTVTMPGAGLEADKIGMEERLPEKELNAERYEVEASPSVTTLLSQSAPLNSRASLMLGHRGEDKKDNSFLEHKMMELQNGPPRLDEIHAHASKQMHNHHMQHHPHQIQQIHAALKPSVSVWGAPQAAQSAGPSFASMLASTNTFAAMLQTGLSPPANQQPISIKLAGTNAFSAVLAAGTFSAVLAQGQDAKDNGRLMGCGEREDGLCDKNGSEDSEHKTDIDSKHKIGAQDDDHQPPLQAHGQVSEVHCADDDTQDHVRVHAQVEQQGEPPQLDVDGHVMGHADGQVEAPSEGRDEGPGDGEGQHDHDGSSQVDGAGPEDYRTMTAHGAEVQHADVEETRRHEAEVPVSGHSADLSAYGQHDVEQQGEHASSSLAEPEAEEEESDHKVTLAAD